MIDNKLLLYADDYTIIVADNNISTVEKVLQTDIQLVIEWLID